MARTRVFEVDQAIEDAKVLFWRDGYDKTSLADLTQAMGITPPSFYFAFGSKEQLFLRVLKHYLDAHFGRVEEALARPNARHAVELMLKRMADLYTDSSHPPGCLAANATLNCTEISDETRNELKELSDARRARLAARLKKAKQEGELARDTDVDDLARYLFIVGWGMALDARRGSSRPALYRAVAMAMRAWPGA